MIPGPVLQFVVIDTFTVATSGVLDFLTSAAVVEEAGRDVGDAGSSVSRTSSVAVEVLVGASVAVGVLVGVKVGGGSFVGVKVDLVRKGVLVEVPLRAYLGAA